MLTIIFIIASFSLFWIFGFGNAMKELLVKPLYNSYGDMAFCTEFYENDKMKELSISIGAGRIIYENEVFCMLDTPQKSDTLKKC